jgi:hypothetical protein
MMLRGCRGVVEILTIPRPCLWTHGLWECGPCRRRRDCMDHRLMRGGLHRIWVFREYVAYFKQPGERNSVVQMVE